MQQKWVASDGMEFVSKEQCKAHEALVKTRTELKVLLEASPDRDKIARMLLCDHETTVAIRNTLTRSRRRLYESRRWD